MRHPFTVLLLSIAGGYGLAADRPPTFEDVVRHTRVGLVGETAVQVELKLTAEQVSAVAKATAAEAATFASGWEALGDKPTDAAVGKLVAATRAGAEAAIGKVLSAEQGKRLTQLELQARGAAAFDDPVVQTALGGVTDEQRKKWAESKDEFDRKLSKLRREAGGVDTVRRIPGTDIPAAGQEVLGEKTVAQLKKEYWLKAKLVLTNEQLDKWYGLIGDVFPNPEKRGK